jgi:ubiquinone/menaquinone biosynthesis C-methylase UbiE
MKQPDTSWGNVAAWYDELLSNAEGTYQKEVILPNMVRLLNIQKGQVVLDLACGQGFFSREFYNAGARVTASDISKELIAIAKKASPNDIVYHVSPADSISYMQDRSADKITIILAIQNIENLGGVLHECARVLKETGSVVIVLNHPAFRIPKVSSWGFDDTAMVQYRRIDAYMSERRERIEMNPGAVSHSHKKHTVSFHRPLQVYFKAFAKAGFAVARLEEWISHKKSMAGPRVIAENNARKEFPLFLALEAKLLR